MKYQVTIAGVPNCSFSIGDPAMDCPDAATVVSRFPPCVKQDVQYVCACVMLVMRV